MHYDRLSDVIIGLPVLSSVLSLHYVDSCW